MVQGWISWFGMAGWACGLGLEVVGLESDWGRFTIRGKLVAVLLGLGVLGLVGLNVGLEIASACLSLGKAWGGLA